MYRHAINKATFILLFSTLIQALLEGLVGRIRGRQTLNQGVRGGKSWMLAAFVKALIYVTEKFGWARVSGLSSLALFSAYGCYFITVKVARARASARSFVSPSSLFLSPLPLDWSRVCDLSLPPASLRLCLTISLRVVGVCVCARARAHA